MNPVACDILSRNRKSEYIDHSIGFSKGGYSGKLGHIPGKDSCGATLADMAEICSSLDMVNAVNLDGGGSAQLLLRNQRSLMISDRKAPQNTEAERPVPLGLIVR